MKNNAEPRPNEEERSRDMSTSLFDFLRGLHSSRFYGSVELKYENGRLTIARKSETSSWIPTKSTVETIEEPMSTSTTTDLHNSTPEPIISGEVIIEALESDPPTSDSSLLKGDPSFSEAAVKAPEEGFDDEYEQSEELKPKPHGNFGNFIEKYREYADILEVPPDAHEAVAMSLIGAVLNRNDVHVKHGAITVPLDLWLILISVSGAGRNTLVGLARSILKESGLEDLIRTPAWGSEPALYQNIAENPRGLYVWPELSIVLKKLAQPNFGGAKVWLTDRYDNYVVPDDIRYRETGRKDTPPIEFSEAPRLNIIATSSEDWLMTNLLQEDTTGGFLPRFLLMRLEGIEKDIPIPRDTDPRLKQELADQLRHINTIQGVVNLSKDVRYLYERWYHQTKKRFLAQANSALAKPFFNRLRNQLLKLAVIHEVADTQTLEVSVGSMEKAIDTAAKIEKTIFALLPTGMNQQGAELLKIEQRIKEGNVDGVTLSTLTKAFQSTPHSERTQRIETLRQGGTIVQFRRVTGGRAAVVNVHEDYVEEHRAKFPDDKERQ